MANSDAEPDKQANSPDVHTGTSTSPFVVRLLAICLAIALLALLALAAFYAYSVVSNDPSRNRVCRTTECYQLSGRLLRNANFSANPCQDFFAYACGAYVNTARHGRWEWFTKTSRGDMGAKMYAGINQVLLYPELRSVDSSANQYWMEPLSKLYRTCLADTVATEQPPFRVPVRDGKDGRWLDLGYILTGRLSDRRMPTEVLLVKLMLYRAPMFVLADYFDNELEVRGLVPYQLHINFVPSLCQAGDSIKQLVGAVLDLIGPEGMSSREKTNLQSLSESICKKMKQLQARLEDARNTTVAKEMTIKELQESDPSKVRISEIFAFFVKEYNLPKRYIQYARDYVKLWVRDPNLSSLLHEAVTSQSALDLNNFAVVHFLVQRARLLGGGMSKIVKQFFTSEKADELLIAPETRAETSLDNYDKWQRCILTLTYSLSPIMTRAFVDEYLPVRLIQRVKGVIKSIKDGFIDNLRSADWIAPSDLAMSIAKVDTIKLHVGYPDIYRNESVLRQIFNGMNVSGSSFGWNYLRQDHYFMKWLIYEFAIGEAELWSMIHISPLAVQAYYVPQYNQVFLAVGILQPPVLYDNMPEQFLLSGIGFVIGHEIGHAFDPFGHKTPFANATFAWNISSVTEERYHHRLPCIWDSYQPITDSLFNTSMRRNSSVGNDLADIVGLTASVRAFQNLEQAGFQWLPGLPGLNPEQTMMLHSVQIFCSAPTNLYYKHIYFPSHSPDFMRVIGAWRNSDYFAKTFKCNPDSFMNPSKKCRIF